MQIDSILERLPWGIVLFDGDLRITYINSAGNYFLNLVSDRGYLTEELVKLVLATSQYNVQQKRLIKIYAHRQLFTVKAKTEMINSSSMIMVILEDRTNVSQLEDTVLKAEELAIKGQIAKGILVEIRNPLTVAKGFCQLITKDEKVEKEYIGLMSEELDKISKMIAGLAVKPDNTRFCTYRDITKDIAMWFYRKSRTSGVILIIDEVLPASISRKTMSRIISGLLNYFSLAMGKNFHTIVNYRPYKDKPGLSFHVKGCVNTGLAGQFFDDQRLKPIIRLIENNNGKFVLTVVNDTTIEAHLSLPPCTAISHAAN